MMDRELNEEI
jgi:hypothetical protein